MTSDTRHIVVTGAESGIGAACAKALGERGDHVTLFYLKDRAAAERSADRVITAGGQAIVVQCAVDDPQSVEAAFTEMETRRGPASILVHSAGINMSGLQVRDMPVETWMRMMAIDLSGAFLTSRRFLQGLAPGQGGAIVHISSIHAFAVRTGGADYCAAKGGVTNLVRTLAIEEAPRGVRVNAIEPGMILTPMNEAAVEDAQVRHDREQHIPMQRAGTADEVARLARWLVSDEASYVTGATVVIDGGLSLVQAVGA